MAKAKRQVSIGTKLSYGTGHSLLSAKNMLFHFFYLFFFANVLGVPEGLVVIATFAALFVDAVSDPLMGQISDNYRSKKWGRRHVFMLWAIIPTAITLGLLFSPPTSLSGTGLFVWMLVLTILVRLGLTMYGVPYSALGAEMSTNYNERTNIFSVREFFSNALNLVVILSGFIIFLPDRPGLEDGMLYQPGYSPFVISMAVMGAIGALICVWGTKNKIPDMQRFEDNERTKWTDTFKQMKMAAGIKPFVWVSTGYSLILILYGAGSALSIYLGTYLWQFSQGEKAIVALAPFLLVPFAVILASVLSAKVDKKPATLLFALIYVLCSIIPYTLYFAGLLPPMGSASLLPLIAVFSAVGFMGFIAVIIITHSMLADVADQVEFETGKRQEGILFAAFSFAQKMTFAIGTAIAGLSLIIISFPRQTKPSDVPQAAVDGLAMTSLVTAIVFGVVSLICLSKYGLTRAKHQEIQRQLAAENTLS